MPSPRRTPHIPCHQSLCTGIGRILTGTTNGSGKSQHWTVWADVARRNAPLRTTFIDDSVTVLTFGLHRSDVVALTDDGTLCRWRKSGSEWREVSRTKNIAGRETFRIRRPAGHENRISATTQLGYNDALAIGNEAIYFGVGQSLKKLVPLN